MVMSMPESWGPRPPQQPPHPQNGEVEGRDVDGRRLPANVSDSGRTTRGISLAVPRDAPTRTRRRFREPQWPSWIDEYFTPAGKLVLERAYVELKTGRPVPRASRLSAEDFAASLYAGFKAEGRTDLICA